MTRGRRSPPRSAHRRDGGGLDLVDDAHLARPTRRGTCPCPGTSWPARRCCASAPSSVISDDLAAHGDVRVRVVGVDDGQGDRGVLLSCSGPSRGRARCSRDHSPACRTRRGHLRRAVGHQRRQACERLLLIDEIHKCVGNSGHAAPPRFEANACNSSIRGAVHRFVTRMSGI